MKADHVANHRHHPHHTQSPDAQGLLSRNESQSRSHILTPFTGGRSHHTHSPNAQGVSLNESRSRANQSQTPSTGGRPNHTQSPDAQGAAIRLDQQNRSNQFASTAEDGRDAIRTDRDGSRLGKYTVFSYFDGRGEFSIDTVVYYLIRITMFLCSLIIVMSQLSNIMRDMMV